jgi:SOS-response transcriptional repressor LexA
MESKQITNEPVRPTKKQKELLSYIENFINEHGYSPSYREIMVGLNYNSVATVSVHVNNLLKRGHLKKRDHSARSLELVEIRQDIKLTSNYVAPGEEKWLVEKVEHLFSEAEKEGDTITEPTVDQLYVLIGALKVLGLEGAAQSFMPRLSTLKQKVVS